MEFIFINSDNLKIILSKEDMNNFDITPEDFDYSKTKSKHILWTILDKAKKETDFNADDAKLYVQLYSSEDGGCEIYITKIKKENKDVKKDNIDEYSKLYIILEFDALVDLCKRLNKDGYGPNCKLYYDRSGKYILIPGQPQIMPSYMRNREAKNYLPEYFYEYGTVKLLQESTIDYFNEHFVKIADGNIPEMLALI